MCTSFAVYGQKKTVYGMTFDTDEIDLRKTFPPAIEAVKNLILGKMKLVSMK